MKTTSLLSLAVVTTAIVSNVAAASLTNFAIGLAPVYPAPESEQIERAMKKFVLDAPMGSQIRFDDAFNLKSIAKFSVPVVRYDSPANRVRVLSNQFAALMQWFKEARSAIQSSALSNVAILRIPEYLDFLAGDGNQPRSILFVGSPLMDYPTEPTFSMTGGEEGPRVPSDGHLLAPVTSSPYGCLERKGRLNGCQISWAYGSERVWSNGLHKSVVTRFWVLFAKQQEATLTTLTADFATALTALVQPGRGMLGDYDLNPEDTKIEMRVARPRQVPSWLPESGTETNSIAQRRVTAVPPESRPIASQNPAPTVARQPGTVQPNLAAPVTSAVDFGIMWESNDSKVDLDIYALPRPGAEELSFKKVRTREGSYIRDWTQPNSRTDFEWIKINPGVRLDQLQIWVNLYRGRGPISGRVAVHFENRVYTGSFSISAATGNGGQNSAARQNDPHWTRINLQQVLTQLQ